MKNHSVLFVCLGNICRSPLAEAALRADLTTVVTRLTHAPGEAERTLAAVRRLLA